LRVVGFVGYLRVGSVVCLLPFHCRHSLC